MFETNFKSNQAFLDKKNCLKNKFISCEPRILLVEDDWQDALYLKELLEDSFGNDFSLIVDTASDFTSALNLLKTKDYDLALFDFKIGYLNGLDLLKSIRSNGLKVPVVFVTGQGDENIAAEAIKSGAADYLVKDDINSKVLADCLTKLINFNSKLNFNFFRKLDYLFDSLSKKIGLVF